jgi:predicted subunit of tRNA(5-methylaminomethyl-2-thiouridylate) methyltransferase
MKAGVLFSGGKDSTLAALLLSPFIDVELVTVSFGIVPNDAAEVATTLGFSFKSLDVEAEIATSIVESMIADGFPNNGINEIHRIALERAAGTYAIVADGTRRDDRVPMLSASAARSLEAKCGAKYVRPLLGYGRSFIDELVAKHFEVVYGECISFDYEVELRDVMRTMYGEESISDIFPKSHQQSKVVALQRQCIA